MTIYEAIAKINSNIGGISKSRKNAQQGFNFRGIDDVMNELHCHFAEAGVFILPEPVGETDIKIGKTKSGGDMFHIFQQWKFTFCSMDGTHITCSGIGEAMDTGDKAMNKTMSIALKYVLLQMFLIPTEEEKDPDAQSHVMQPKPAEKPKPAMVPDNIDGLLSYAASEGLSCDATIAMAKKKYTVSKEIEALIVKSFVEKFGEVENVG